MSAVGNVIVGSFIGSEYSLTDINFYRSLNFLITAFALWGIMIMLSPDKSTVPGLKV